MASVELTVYKLDDETTLSVFGAPLWSTVSRRAEIVVEKLLAGRPVLSRRHISTAHFKDTVHDEIPFFVKTRGDQSTYLQTSDAGAIERFILSDHDSR